VKLSGYIRKELIAPRMSAGNKSQLLDVLLALAEKAYALGDRGKVLGDLIAREKQSSTGIGCSIAVPHTIVAALPKTIMVLASIPDGIDFDAVDGKPVKAVFLLLSPPNQVGEHIRLLARIARICSSEALVRKLAEAQTADELMAAITREDERHVG